MVRMGNADATGERDGRDSLGPVHRSGVRKVGSVLWALAFVSVVVVGRYAAIARVQETIRESLVPLLQVVAVVILFVGLVSLTVGASKNDGARSRAK